MAKTQQDLYRAITGKSYKIKIGHYPGDGVLDPRWESHTYFNKSKNREVTSRADVVIEMGVDGPEVLPGNGTSLHDVPGWFPTTDFWIPEGTEYSDELKITKDPKLKTSDYNASLKGHHFRIECKTRMPMVMMKGYLDNMARAAVVRQCELART